MIKSLLRSFRKSLALNRLQNFYIPDPGDEIAQVQIQKWFVKPGEKVQQFQILCISESAKNTPQYKSEYDGIIQQTFGQIGQVMNVGSLLYTIQVDDEKYPQKQKKTLRTAVKSETPKPPSKPAPIQTKPPQIPPPPPVQPVLQPQPLILPGKFLATPSVRHLAKQQNIDLSLIKGSGRDGRILKQDLISTKKSPSIPQQTSVQPQILQLNQVQRAMARTMQQSLSIPHMVFCQEVDMTRLIELRNILKQKFKDIKLTFMPFFIKAMSLAILEYPVVNSIISPCLTKYTQFDDHNIGFAIDTPRGLVVPNVKRCQEKSILDIAQEMQRIISLGNEGRVQREDVLGGTISLSNIGNIGGTYTGPIILSPQSLIGAVGRMKDVLSRGVDGSILDKKILPSSWSGDHRLLDGATTARFVMKWKEVLEEPGLMLVNMR